MYNIQYGEDVYIPDRYKGINVTEVERLSSLYARESHPAKRNKYLSSIFTNCQGLVNWQCNLYKKCHLTKQDIMQHVHIGIAKGLEKRKEEDKVVAYAIYRQVRSELSNNISKHFSAKKRGRDIPFTDYTSSFPIEEEHMEFIETIVDSSVRMEEACVLQIDIEKALVEMPDKERNVLILYLQGYSMKEIQRELNLSKSKSASLTYYYLKKGKKYLQESLTIH